MDFNMKQWREKQQESEEEEQQRPYAKIPRQHLTLQSFHHHQLQEAAALPLFVPSEPHDNKITTTIHCSSYSDGSSTPTLLSISSPRFPSVRGGGCFSIAQWQELELQALIFRHMIAGAAVPSELLQVVKKSLLTSSSSPCYLHHHSPHFHQAALLQGGYWGKGAMDPEPGRCRRTDGKKWRCSRDLMDGHKYCNRHVHRGRNRSRKPVEFPSSASAAGGSGGGLGPLNNTSATAFVVGSGGAGGIQFSASASAAASSLDGFQLNQGSSSELSHHEQERSAGGEKSNSSMVLMHFFDDWPTSLQQSQNGGSNSTGNSSSVNLSMSTTRDQTSDFLRLSTGNGGEVSPRGSNGNIERDRARGWIGGGWGGSQLGGPLGEALRSSAANLSHSRTSVLHQLPRCSASDTSRVTA